MATPIQNAQGMTVQELRNEIDRGGRLVVYFYCLSVLFTSFKRVSKVHLIRSGSIRASASWPYNFLSLLCGWWALPFGVRYSFESLKQNLAGGLDVTESWLAAASGMDPHAALDTVTVPLPHTETPSADVEVRLAFLCGALMLALFGFLIFCFYVHHHVSVVLVNGLEQSYEIRLNNQFYLVPARSYILLKLPAGSYKIHAELNPSTVLTDDSFKLKQSVFDRQVAFINPDRLAIVYYENAQYLPPAYQGQDPQPWIEISPNQPIMVTHEPDYLLTDFPEALYLRRDDPNERCRMDVVFPESLENAAKILMSYPLYIEQPKGIKNRLMAPFQRQPEESRENWVVTYLAQYQKLHPDKKIDSAAIMSFIKDWSKQPEENTVSH